MIVGGGVLGTMHAVMARRRGFSVMHLEREPEARGASVRNFGLVWVSGRRAGPELALALRARELWEEIAASAPGTGFRPAGSLTLATREAELRGDARGGRAARRQAARVRAARPRRGARGEPGAARRVPRRAVLPGRRDRGAAGRAARACVRRWRGRGTSGCPAGRPSRSSRTECGTSAADGTAVTSWCCAPGRTSPAWPGRTWRPRRTTCGGCGCRCCRRCRSPGRSHVGRRRRLAALLPGLRRAVARPARAADRRWPRRAARSCCSCSALDGGADHRGHPRLRRAVRLRRGRGAPTTTCWPAPRRCSAARCRGCSGGGPASTARWPARPTLYHRSVVAPGVVLVTGPGGRGMTCSPAIAEETFLMSQHRISVACLDMAGTTVSDDGTVMAAFAAAIASSEPARRRVHHGDEVRQGDDGPVEDRGVPAHPRFRGRRAGGERGVRGALRGGGQRR